MVPAVGATWREVAAHSAERVRDSAAAAGCSVDWVHGSAAAGERALEVGGSLLVAVEGRLRGELQASHHHRPRVADRLGLLVNRVRVCPISARRRP